MSRRSRWVPVCAALAVLLAPLLASQAARAAEGWNETRWGMTPAELSRLHPALRPVAEARRLDCVRSRIETFEREGIVDWDGLRWDARFCFEGRRDRLRAVYLAPADGAAPDAAALARSLTARHGTPLPPAGGASPTLREWRDGQTLVTLDTSPNAGWTVTYEAVSQPIGRSAGEWRYVAPAGAGGAKFGWFDPAVPLEFLGFLLICREGDLRPGQVVMVSPLGGPSRPRRIEVRVGDGTRAVTVAGAPDVAADELTLWAVLPGSHLLFGLLAETREDRTLTVSAPQLRQPHRYALRGALPAYRQFAQACALQPPP